MSDRKAIAMRRLATLRIALPILAALAAAACQNIVIRPPGDVAGYYANPNGSGGR